MVYRPKEPTGIESLEQLLSYVQDELYQIGLEITNASEIRFQVLHVAPDRAREGMVVVADGSDWNPGGGAGIYLYIGGAWTKL